MMGNTLLADMITGMKNSSKFTHKLESDKDAAKRKYGQKYITIETVFKKSVHRDIRDKDSP